MRNPIVLSTFFVFAFWWIIAFIWGAIHYNEVPERFLFLGYISNAVIIAVAVFLATGFMVWADRWIRKGGLKGIEERGVISSIGLVPNLVKWDRGTLPIGVDVNRWPLTHAWQSKAPEEYRNAFNAIMETIYSKPSLPASPVTGGHGGLTLFEHTLNVVEQGLKTKDTWLFQRRKSDPLKGSALPTNLHNAAVIMLAGHDIGKMKSFIVEDGKVVDWKRSHDREGAQILATLHEMWNISEDDRKAIIAAVAHEHHPQDLPTHTGDEAQLLMEFLIDVDEWASREEEGKVDVDSEEYNGELFMEGQNDEDVWFWFVQTLAKPNTVNGRDERFRIAFKDENNTLYFNEQKIRTLFANDFFKDPLLAEAKRGDGRSIITERLLKILDSKGVLQTSWQDYHFSYKNALFKLESFNPKGRKLGEWSAAFIVNLDKHLPGNIKALEPAPNPPKIKEPVFPQRAFKTETSISEAIAKSQGQHKEAEINVDVTHQSQPNIESNDQKQTTALSEEQYINAKSESIASAANSQSSSKLLDSASATEIENNDSHDECDISNINQASRSSLESPLLLSSVGNDWDDNEIEQQIIVHSNKEFVDQNQKALLTNTDMVQITSNDVYSDVEVIQPVLTDTENTQHSSTLDESIKNYTLLQKGHKIDLYQNIDNNLGSSRPEIPEIKDVHNISKSNKLLSIESPIALGKLKDRANLSSGRRNNKNFDKRGKNNSMTIFSSNQELASLHCVTTQHSSEIFEIFGMFVIYLFKGMKKKDLQSLVVNEDENYVLSASQAVKFAEAGGLNVVDLDVFVSSVGESNDKLFNGVIFRKNESGKIVDLTIKNMRIKKDVFF